jgi:hypothetical protein
MFQSAQLAATAAARMTAMSDEPKRQSLAWTGRAAAAYAAHQSVRFLFGIAGLAFGGAILSLAIGIGLTDVALDAFWPYRNNVAWIRVAGGVAALLVFLSAVKWRSRWSWPQFLVAISLFPINVLLWACAITWIFDPHPNPIRPLCDGLALAIALGVAGGILVRRFGPRRMHRE